MHPEWVALFASSKALLRVWWKSQALDSALLMSERGGVVVVGGEGRRPSAAAIGQLRRFLDELEAANERDSGSSN